MRIERRRVVRAREFFLEGITNADRGGIYDAPVLHASQNVGKIDLLGRGIAQSAVGRLGHELFQRLVTRVRWRGLPQNTQTLSYFDWRDYTIWWHCTYRP
jgi:hypothetical protein